MGISRTKIYLCRNYIPKPVNCANASKCPDVTLAGHPRVCGQARYGSRAYAWIVSCQVDTKPLRLISAKLGRFQSAHVGTFVDRVAQGVLSQLATKPPDLVSVQVAPKLYGLISVQLAHKSTASHAFQLETHGFMSNLTYQR